MIPPLFPVCLVPLPELRDTLSRQCIMTLLVFSFEGFFYDPELGWLKSKEGFNMGMYREIFLFLNHASSTSERFT